MILHARHNMNCYQRTLGKLLTGGKEQEKQKKRKERESI